MMEWVVFFLVLLLFIAVALAAMSWLRETKPVSTGWRRQQTPCVPEHPFAGYCQPKPPWVRNEIIRLNALMAEDGCRTVALVFNRVNRASGMTVGNTFVSNVIRNHLYEIQVLRTQIKRRKPPVTPKNRLWQIDLTGKPTDEKPRQAVFGVLDHGPRVCLALSALPSKATIRILIVLLQTMEQFSKPRAVRTDNEAVFTSKLFTVVMWLVGIRHQRIEMCCPWPSGRVERMFLTLKQSLDRLAFANAFALNEYLSQWRFWYNFVRPHQHLDGCVPAEIWNGTAVLVAKGEPVWVEDETGFLRGYYVPK